jgi:hypothetical protein
VDRALPGMARQRHDERFWRERVEKWDASGVSAGEFATREGLRPERLLFWKRRLRASIAMAVAGVSFARLSRPDDKWSSGL